MKLLPALATITACSLVLSSCALGPPAASPPEPTRTIVMVWDGLRPDSVNETDTPNLHALRARGVDFADNHSTYPTFTMLNGSSFATGSFPKTSGFYGNTFWTPPRADGPAIPVGKSAGGATLDYTAPIFTEDYAVLATLNDWYDGRLLLVDSLFASARAAGLVTATIGKSGAAYLQDLGRGASFVDENTVLPRSLAVELQNAGIALPRNTATTATTATAAGDASAKPVTLASDNGNPTARPGYITFDSTAYDPAGVVAIAARDSSDTTQQAGEDAANRYMLAAFTRYILPVKKPMLSLIWFRTPDTAEHGYGPGSANARAGLRSQDARLGELMAALKAQSLESTTNVIVVSDHGHSSVSGPLDLYPLRAIAASATPPGGPKVNSATSGTSGATLGGVTSAGGFSFSGDVRSADLLTYRGLPAFDGGGCGTSAMFGLDAAGVPTLPVRLDRTGALCGAPNTRYQAVSASLAAPVASFRVPAPGAMPPNAVVVAANGGSDYFYVPGHDPSTVARLVDILQRREEFGAIFVDSRYGELPGTLPMSMVNLENAVRRDHGQPDVVTGFNWDDTVSIQGMAGIEFESAGGQRGMHGSFGPTDVHNTWIASGPSFRTGTALGTPTGNVDLAPTVAWLLGLRMPRADGRIVDEALRSPSSLAMPSVTARTITPTRPATGLAFELPTDLTGKTLDPSRPAGTYSIDLKVKDLAVDGRMYRYFDSARAVRR